MMLPGVSGEILAANITGLMAVGHSAEYATAVAQAFAVQGERAAGIMYTDTRGYVLLLLRRAETEDFPLTWCFPGGTIDEGETAEQAALRESFEEVQFTPIELLTGGRLSLIDWCDGFTTFGVVVPEAFVPRLNHEHIGYAWAPLNALPSPMHPGCSATLARTAVLAPIAAMDERTVDGNGWYEVRANPLSKAGIFPYSGRQLGFTGEQANQIFQVLRPEEELSDPACVDSFKLIPWVDEHTMLGPAAQDDIPGAVAAENKGVQGVIGEEVFFKDGTLYGNIKVFSSTLASLIAAGKKQLSAGYRCVYEMTSGVLNGQPFDAVQRKIRGNHLALVAEGRMGPDVAVMDTLNFSFDAAEASKMADPKEPGTGEGGDDVGSMTLEEAIALVNQLAPQIKKLQAAMATMGGTPAEPEGEDPPVVDEKPALAAPVVGEEKPAAVDEKPAVAAGMDAAVMERNLLARIGKRDALARQLSGHIGTFDHADKTYDDVVRYGCEKLGVKAERGQEAAALSGFLQARPAGVPAVRAGLDSAAPKAGFLTTYFKGE